LAAQMAGSAPLRNCPFHPFHQTVAGAEDISSPSLKDVTPQLRAIGIQQCECFVPILGDIR